jgi:hypothetical protein
MSVTATRYVTPLREGGSLPGLVEADDDGLYVVKFRGAGQGTKALVAEVLVGELARALGFPVPELVVVDVQAALGAAEPDPEIQDLINASTGANLGVDFLPGALAFDETAARDLDPEWAAGVVWLDALTTNVDRTPRNPNLLVWHGRTWLIDHGAALYLQHGADDLPALAERPFPSIADHVLRPHAGSIAAAHERLAGPAAGAIEGAAAAVPEAWLPAGGAAPYAEYLRRRLAWGGFAEEAERARA